MKKLIIAIVLVLSTLSFGQQATEWFAYKDTVSNSTNKTYYLYLEDEVDRQLDSIAFQVVATGEIDIDAFTVTKGLDFGGTFYSVASDSSATLTIDNAAGTTTAVLVTSTSVATDALEGITALKIVLEPASSGNDATDPNAFYIRAIKYFTY